MARAMTPGTCCVCGRGFLFRRRTTRPDPVFCSKSCILRQRIAQDPEYQSRAGVRAGQVIAAKYRGTGTRTYVKEGGRHQHRVVAERMLGRPLAHGEVVHHKDGNKKNNDPANLLVTTQAAHMREHGLGIPGMTLWWKPWTKRRSANANV